MKNEAYRTRSGSLIAINMLKKIEIRKGKNRGERKEKKTY